ncbi:Uncharacterized protein TCM_020303 [Theobroma cacao]|uniref:Uncharacterized protein n=1 Tax=Theobroma cacao TaxID=3641 RepID=A0A061EKT9_THECC|nr:Uncharacterized protein TCM_020303 [Theobroma cacao]
MYAIRQSIAKALVAFYQNYVDEQSKKKIKDISVWYDRTLVLEDPRPCEPKKFSVCGGIFGTLEDGLRFETMVLFCPDQIPSSWEVSCQITRDLE